MSHLTRRHVGRMLATYYSQPADAVVGSNMPTINFSSLHWEWQWRRKLAQAYRNRKGHWLTPSEIFAPYFSNIMANFCAQAFLDRSNSSAQNNDNSNNTQLPTAEIYELGGGRGTNATLILDHIQKTHPELYSSLSYTLVDSSPTLHDLQKEILMNTDHASKLKFKLLDLMDVAENKATLFSKSDIPTVVLGMEVLDNLPHDKIRTNTKRGRIIEQAEVVERSEHEFIYAERFTPLNDPLIQKVVERCPSFAQTGSSWIPTVACGVLDHIGQQRPYASIALADFDWLPPADLLPSKRQASRLSEQAEGEPIVTSMDGQDHPCYLSSPNAFCDILFPTQFDKLAQFARRKQKHGAKKVYVRVDKQATFLERYGPEQIKQTTSWMTGYTPLLHDFINCSVLSVTTR